MAQSKGLGGQGRNMGTEDLFSQRKLLKSIVALVVWLQEHARNH